ncbi:MAG: hypothetical protein ACOY3Y_06980 [Acidobacteriota bacterium]
MPFQTTASRSGAGAPSRGRSRAILFAVLAVGMLVAGQAPAQISAAPPSVSIFPTQTSATVNLTISNITAGSPGVHAIAFSGLPAGVSTVPASVTYTFPAALPGSASTTFQFQATAATTPGTYTINMQDPSALCGGPPGVPCAGSMTLQIQAPSYTALATPNPATIVWGGTQNITVTITPDPGYTTPLNVWFGGFPAGISVGGTQTVSPPYPPLTFNFSVSPGTTPQTYNGTMFHGPMAATPATSPMAVIVPPPDILVSYTQPSMSVCEGGSAVANGIVLQSSNGYAGTPVLSFITVPAGLTVTPLNPVAAAMPPNQIVPFTVQATGAAPGSYTVVLRVEDAVGFPIVKFANLTVNVGASDFTPGLSPPNVSVPAGGTTTGFQASLTGNACFSAATVTVTPSGVPAGLTLTPPSVTLTGPGYVPAGFTIQAATTVAPGTYPLTFTFTPSTGTPHTANATVTVTAGPDFTLDVAPLLLPVPAGGSGQVTVSAAGLNGFADTITVTSAGAVGVTLVPATFTLVAGGSMPVTVQIAPTAPVGPVVIAFSGTAPSVVGPRETNFTLDIAAGPDFAMEVVPQSVPVQAGSTATVAVGAQALNGFADTISVTATPGVGVTLTPAAFTLTPGSTVPVTVAVSPTAPVGAQSVSFTGTAPSVLGPRTVTLNLDVTPGPDFTLAVTPPAIALIPGGSAQVTVAATPLYGFTGTVNVVAPSLPGVTFAPAAFAVAAGGTQIVAVTAAMGTLPGTVSGTFSATAPTVTGTRTAAFAVQFVPPPDFALTLTPAAVVMDAGTSAQVSVGVTPLHGFNAPVTVTIQAPAGLTVDPVSLTIPAGGARPITLRTPADSYAASHVAQLQGVASGITGARSATLPVTVNPLPPAIEAVVPPALSVGTADSILRLSGTYFRPGAIASSPTPDLTITRTTVISPTLADVAVSIRAGAPAGSYRIDLTNPDGTRTSQGVLLVVFPTTSLAAPLGVTVAAVVHPLPYTILSTTDSLYPRGLLATTGLGTVVGSWHLDGMPFDHFTAQVSGGMPVEVKASVPIPLTFVGEHRLELVIEQPRSLVSTPVPVIQALDSRSQFTILAPDDGAAFGVQAPLMRWSLLPGASGFLVEIVREGGGPSIERRMAESEWRPSAADIAELGPGQHQFRVSPVFPGEVEGEPTPWRSFVILPERVELTFEPMQLDPVSGRSLVRWTGGVPGLVYRLELYAEGAKVPFASALTRKQEYLLPANAPPGPLRARVRALDHEGGPRGGSGLVLLTVRTSPQARRNTYRLAQLPAQLTATSPADGESVTTRRPRLEARWSGAVRPEEVILLLDATDVTQMAVFEPDGVSFEVLEELGEGPHTVQLSLAGVVSSWTFTVFPDGVPAAPEGAPALPEGVAPPIEEVAEAGAGLMPPPHRDGEALIQVTVNGQEEQGGASGWETARGQLSTRFDIATGAVEAKATGDIGGSHTLQTPHTTASESRNWDVQLAAGGPNFRAEARGGYSPPDFLDQSEFLMAGLARGGVQGKAITPVGALSYYRTTNDIPASVGTSMMMLSQQIEAAGYQFPGDPNTLLLRAFALRSEDEGIPEVPATSSEAVGIFGRWAVSPKLQLLFEGARGRLEPADAEKVEGNAFRVGATGTLGKVTYGLTLRDTAAEFINPANPGLTPGGVPDRRGGDLSLSTMLGRASLSLQARRLQSGGNEGGGPTITEDGTALNLSLPLGQRVSMSASATLNATEGAADPERYLPATDRSMTGLTLNFTEMAGVASFSQALSWQEMEDQVNSGSNQEVMSVNLSANGTMAPWLSLNGMLSGTRTDAAQPMGRTDQYMAAVQPTFTLASLHLTLTPRGSYSRTENDVSSSVSESEQYQFVVQYAPPWLGSFLAIELAADLSRSMSSYQEGSPPFQRRVVATLTVRRGATLPQPAAVQPVASRFPSPFPSDMRLAGRL